VVYFYKIDAPTYSQHTEYLLSLVCLFASSPSEVVLPWEDGSAMIVYPSLPSTAPLPRAFEVRANQARSAGTLRVSRL
jgi:hypothetical protein